MNNTNTTNLPKAIFLMGPTASGKTQLAIKLYQIIPIELISVDSALVYRGMDIGTGKPSPEEQYIAPHRLIDIRDPTQIYSVENFRNDALAEMSKIVKKGRIPLLVGGTMFYYKALLEGLSILPSANKSIRQYIETQAKTKGWIALHKELEKIDSIASNRIHPNDLQRLSRALEVFFISGKTLTELTQTPRQTLPYKVYQFAIAPTNRVLLYRRIEERFHKMLALGFEKEVQTLFSRTELNSNIPAIRCVGYRQIWSYLEGNISYNEMILRSIFATKQLAKRQMTWLKHWREIHWLNDDKPKQAIDKIVKLVTKSY